MLLLTNELAGLFSLFASEAWPFARLKSNTREKTLQLIWLVKCQWLSSLLTLRTNKLACLKLLLMLYLHHQTVLVLDMEVEAEVSLCWVPADLALELARVLPLGVLAQWGLYSRLGLWPTRLSSFLTFHNLKKMIQVFLTQVEHNGFKLMWDNLQNFGFNYQLWVRPFGCSHAREGATHLLKL